MRLCEFCGGSVDDTTNQCPACGAPQSIRPVPAATAQPATPVAPTPAATGQPTAPITPSAASLKKVGALWLVWLFIPYFNGIGLIWIGAKAEKNAWIVEGVIYSLPLVALMFMDLGEGEELSATIGLWAVISWIICLVRGFKLKRQYEDAVRGLR